ncbi:MAG: hypothetical protein MRECE_14c024 [Mycoplasmataceae bacterium CE_OT135]|nr:MAG: hypothetical protein MRECE_14c024 [Mycoplasmataceae bacterium CE_OT135]
MGWFVKLKDFIIKFYLLAPCLYAFFNYFFVIKEEQRWTAMGWVWLILSVAYFGVALYFTIKNW